MTMLSRTIGYKVERRSRETGEVLAQRFYDLAVSPYALTAAANARRYWQAENECDEVRLLTVVASPLRELFPREEPCKSAW